MTEAMERLVAFVIVAFVLAAIYGTISGVMTTRVRVQQCMDKGQIYIETGSLRGCVRFVSDE